MNTIVLRVSEIEIAQRSMQPYYKGNVVSALGDLLALKRLLQMVPA
jgi:hypothetical protein